MNAQSESDKLEKFRARFPKRDNKVVYIGGPREGRTVTLSYTTNMITCGDDAQRRGMHGVYRVTYRDINTSDGVATWQELPKQVPKKL